MMRVNWLLLFLTGYSLLLSAPAGQSPAPVFPGLAGPWLGQKPPGMIPEIFAPGIISTPLRELNSLFSPGGREFYFCIQTPGQGYRIHYSTETPEGWTTPRPAPFSGEGSNVDVCFSPDGQRIYFGSTRPVNGRDPGDFKIWYAERTPAGWSEARYLDSPVNAGRRALYPSISRNGTMFFQAIQNGSFGDRDIYFSRLTDGKYGEPVHLPAEINSPYGEGDVLTAPDESWLIVNCNGRPGEPGNGDLYISFKKRDGSWTPLKNMGPPINSPASDYCPMLSPDGKYLFFTSTRSGNGDIYWVDARIIGRYREKED